MGNIEVTANGARIYYGELIEDGGQDVYSVVGAPAGAEPREFDQPESGSDEGQLNNTYDGEGGVSIGGFFRQLTFAIYYRERNFLLSGEVNDDSKVLYVRDPRERVEKAAPVPPGRRRPVSRGDRRRGHLDPRRLHDLGRPTRTPSRWSSAPPPRTR